MEWRLLSYRSSSGRDEIAMWVDSWRGKNRIKVLQVLGDIERFPKESWPPKSFKLLSGACSGLGEIRLKLDQVNHRLLTFFGPGDRELTLLIAATEKNWKFVPRDACEIAQKRKREVLTNRERLNELGS